MLEFAYILLFVTLMGVILWMARLAMRKMEVPLSTQRRRLVTILLGVLGWIAIQIALSTAGIYDDLSLPPRIPLLMILPLFVFAFVFLNRNKQSPILHAIPIHIPIVYQSFRAVIEVLFYFTFVAGILPIQVTFGGANYDVLLGISAIFVGLYAYRTDASPKLLIAWNILGIAVVGFAAFTFISSFYFPEIWGDGEPNLAFNRFPFLLLPSFFMPSAIFMHLLSIVQLRRSMKTDAPLKANQAGRTIAKEI
ncbi:MAG: hypothetical protein AAF135_14820 [Bacteroidota bacterium]